MMIGKLFKFIIIFYSLNIIISFSYGNDFIRLEGRQFKNGVTDFYPMVLNYLAYFNIDSQGNIFATPPTSNGADHLDYECHNFGDCQLEFGRDLDKVKLMGFNTIRLILCPYYRLDRSSNSRFFSLSINQQWYDMDFPTFTNVVSQSYFNAIRDILDLAEQRNIKVILLVAEDTPIDHDHEPDHFTPVYNSVAVAEYEMYLKALASELNGETALFAYDLWNEPLVSEMFQGENDVRITKQEICQYVAQWYDAIKVNDANHLVTLGGGGPEEIAHWDMGIMKLDFYSLHIYPNHNPFLHNHPNNVYSSIVSGMEQFEIVCYWMNEVCPIPWIIGETGFSADNNTIPSDYLSNLQNAKSPPAMHGSESQQEEFAKRSLKAVRDNLGSGYSWWKFQNSTWYNPYTYPEYARENYFGLLHFGDCFSPIVDKQLISNNVFNFFMNPLQPPQTVSRPANYYDPLRIKEFLNTVQDNSISGHVLDHLGNPIKNAVVIGYQFLERVNIVANDPTQGQRNVYASPFTFTDENGAFTIVPYNFSNSHDPNNFHNIVHVSVRGVGTDYECQGRCTWDILDEFGNTHMSNPSNLIFNLKRVETGFEIQTPPNTIVSSGVNDHFYAGNSLLVSNMTVLSGANSDFTARQKIRLNPSFHALAGSNIHVFTSASKPECIEFDNFMRLSKPITSILSDEEDSNKSIIIEFNSRLKLAVKIYPNPTLGKFHIMVNNPISEHVMVTYSNMIGEIIWSGKVSNNVTFNQFTSLPKGVYLLKVENELNSVVEKLIIN